MNEPLELTLEEYVRWARNIAMTASGAMDDWSEDQVECMLTAMLTREVS